MPNRLPLRHALPLWVLFVIFCFGLGYPTLNRYDPGKTLATSDAAEYCALVRAPFHIDYRAFVPWIARPFYLIATGHIKTWDPALFGMLMANSMLTAGAMIGILVIGLRYGLPWATSLIAAFLFLLDWTIPNFSLSAYVDSGEVLCLVLLTWSMLSNRWYLLPLWAIPGSLSKETYAPFALVFALTWWLLDRPLRWRRAGWIALAAALGCGAVVAELHSPGVNAVLGSGTSNSPGAVGFTVGMGDYRYVGFFRAFLGNLTAREFWYTFAWLLPLGLWRIRTMDRRWIWAAATTFTLALLMGAYNAAGGNTARAFFNIAGPLLCLSAASSLAPREAITA
ncbi:MAG: hypothetical protein WCF17_19080 [Terracidiphilus sp.]